MLKVKTSLIMGFMAVLLGLPMIVQAQGRTPGHDLGLPWRVTTLEAGQRSLGSTVGYIQKDINALLSAVRDLQDAVDEVQGEGGGGVSESDDLEWTGTHTWKTHAEDGTGKTLKRFTATVPAQDSSTVIFSLPIPNDTMMFLLIYATQKEIPPVGALPIGVGSAMAIANIGGNIDGDRE